MFLPNKALRSLSIAALATGTATAQATSIASFSFTPQAVEEQAATAVPLLSDLLLVMLGLVLTVVALRSLHAQRGAQKLLSIALLSAGVLLGAIGAERSYALISSVYVIGDQPSDLSCAGVVDQTYNLYHSDTATVTNNCPVPGQVTTKYSGPCELGGGTCGLLGAGSTCILPDEVCTK